MKNRKLIAKKMKLFYEDVRQKPKGRKTHLQTNQECLQKQIKNLNSKHNIQMLTTHLRGGKAFTAEQNIGKLKKRLTKKGIKNKS